MSDLGLCKYYLGMAVTRDCKNRILRLGQRAYLEKILLDYQMMDCKPSPTLIETQYLTIAYYQPDEQFRTRYQSAVGSLIYAMLGTRPDLAFAVSVVSRYSSKPNDSHWQGVKRILRYIKGTLDLQLTFRGPLTALTRCPDADWAGDQDTRRSTSGFVFNLGSGAISWSSKREPTVAPSSCEAAYMGQTQAVKEAVWLKSLLDQLLPPSDADSTSSTSADSKHFQKPTDPNQKFSFSAVIIYCDNQGAIALAKNPKSHARSKHIDIQWHYQRERLKMGPSSSSLSQPSNRLPTDLRRRLQRKSSSYSGELLAWKNTAQYQSPDPLPFTLL